MAAIKRYFSGEVHQTALAAMPFSSAKKYGGVSFHEDETYLLGAPEILLAACPEKDRFLPQAEEWSAKGCRVLLLALYDGKLDPARPRCLSTAWPICCATGGAATVRISPSP